MAETRSSEGTKRGIVLAPIAKHLRTVVTILCVALGLGAFAQPSGASGPSADETLVALLSSDADRDAMGLRRVLSDADAKRYARIFVVQEDGDWAAADALIARLDDRILMGHVLSQRYLHPTRYRSKYVELKDWMAEYADHPSAKRIYKLALRRRPANWNYPEKPDLPSRMIAAAGTGDALPYRQGLSSTERRKVRQYRRQILRYLGRGLTLASKRLISTEEVRRLFSDAQYDEMKALQGHRYFIDGRDEWALQWAGEAADRSGHLVAESHWAAGLAAYRLGRLDVAARHFEALARNADSSPWMVSAGGFWAARTYLVNREPARVAPMMRLAATHPRTFYGLLARELLGWPMDFEWTPPPLDEATFQALHAAPRGRRAVALIEAGQERLAELELRYMAAGVEDETLAHGILALAARAGLPELSLRLDEMLFPSGGFDNASYPVPGWEPADGFTIDPALIYALIRQESKFNPKAKSWAGARGLMQLMPRTASFVARDRSLRSSQRRKLYDPEFNLTLGQRYIEMLLSDDNIQGNLLATVAAWNGGPGNLNKWRRTVDYRDDPLLFIESIPARETRIFVEKVFTNLWIYRNRLGEPAPSLTALARGDWPVYVAVGATGEQVAEK